MRRINNNCYSIYVIITSIELSEFQKISLYSTSVSHTDLHAVNNFPRHGRLSNKFHLYHNDGTSLNYTQGM